LIHQRWVSVVEVVAAVDHLVASEILDL